MIKLGIFVNKEKDYDFSITNQIIAVSNSLGVECEIANIDERYDFIISLGGDGTFLFASRKFLNMPILGINLGHLGFLSESNRDDIHKVILNLINNNYRIEERFLLETEIRGEKVTALNEIVINRGNDNMRLLNLSLDFNGKHVDNYRADGLIISTPTGSTAYSLSAGGPIIEPRLDVVAITPICAHSLHQRPIIVDANTLITILSEKDECTVTADGQVSKKCINNFEIKIKKSDKKVKVVKFLDRCFFDIVREKFHLD